MWPFNKKKTDSRKEDQRKRVAGSSASPSGDVDQSVFLPMYIHSASSDSHSSSSHSDSSPSSDCGSSSGGGDCGGGGDGGVGGCGGGGD